MPYNQKYFRRKEKMKEKFAKLIDVKSIVTVLLVATLVYLVISGRDINSDVFLLFSNATTMIITYFFTKKKEGE
jgi:4-amino-4-deoxy-L-arabinose transferase-like glycosyltransferase